MQFKQKIIISCNCGYNLIAVENFASLAVYEYCLWVCWGLFFVKAL